MKTQCKCGILFEFRHVLWNDTNFLSGSTISGCCQCDSVVQEEIVRQGIDTIYRDVTQFAGYQPLDGQIYVVEVNRTVVGEKSQKIFRTKAGMLKNLAREKEKAGQLAPLGRAVNYWESAHF